MFSITGFSYMCTIRHNPPLLLSGNTHTTTVTHTHIYKHTYSHTKKGGRKRENNK